MGRVNNVADIVYLFMSLSKVCVNGIRNDILFQIRVNKNGAIGRPFKLCQL